MIPYPHHVAESHAWAILISNIDYFIGILDTRELELRANEKLEKTCLNLYWALWPQMEIHPADTSRVYHIQLIF